MIHYETDDNRRCNMFQKITYPSRKNTFTHLYFKIGKLSSLLNHFLLLFVNLLSWVRFHALTNPRITYQCFRLRLFLLFTIATFLNKLQFVIISEKKISTSFCRKKAIYYIYLIYIIHSVTVRDRASRLWRDAGMGWLPQGCNFKVIWEGWKMSVHIYRNKYVFPVTTSLSISNKANYLSKRIFRRFLRCVSQWWNRETNWLWIEFICIGIFNVSILNL